MAIWSRKKTVQTSPSELTYSFIPPGYVAPRFRDYTFTTLVREGFKSDAAVHAAVGAWALAYPEPKPKIYAEDGEIAEGHPLIELLEHPNPYMDWAELRRLSINFRLIGGNCYIYKSRNEQGEVVALYPYHDGWITPIPSAHKWIESYRYNDGRGDITDIDPNDIIHLKWFQPDPEQPWKGFSPLMALGRDIDTNVEMAKTMLAVMQNDAMPRTAITIPPLKNADGSPATPISDVKRETLKAKFKEKFGGGSKGEPIILTEGMDIKRISMDFKELDMAALHDIPEAHVCAVLLTPIEILGLNLGQKSSTYSNKEQALKIWTEQRLVPMWSADDSALTRGLGADFKGYEPVTIVHDIKGVVALRENDAKNETATSQLYLSGIITRNESRTRIGQPPVDGGDIFFKSTTVSPDGEPIPLPKA